MLTAINKREEEFNIGDECKLVSFPTYNKRMAGVELVVVDVQVRAASESGFNLLVKVKETGEEFPRSLDANWFTK